MVGVQSGNAGMPGVEGRAWWLRGGSRGSQGGGGQKRGRPVTHEGSDPKSGTGSDLPRRWRRVPLSGLQESPAGTGGGPGTARPPHALFPGLVIVPRAASAGPPGRRERYYACRPPLPVGRAEILFGMSEPNIAWMS
jgi:hypothetical protein